MNYQPMDIPKLRQWLLQGDYTPILKLARKRKRVLSLLTAFTYDHDPVVSNRAITYTGLAAKIINDRDPEYIRNYLLRLFWLVNDESGSIGWRAPELIGEILYNCPNFEQFFPMLVSLLDLEKEDAPQFKNGVIWAIDRVAQARKDAMSRALLKRSSTTPGALDK
jgi:hypothetical protein